MHGSADDHVLHPEPGAGLSWATFLGGRLLRLAVIVALVAVVAFLLTAAAPIDPVDAFLGPRAMSVTPEQRVLIAERWGLDQPALARFRLWAGHALHGDFGLSPIYNMPVAQVIAERFRASLALMAIAWTLSGALGFTLGVVAGMRAGSRIDRAIRLYAYTLAATPTLWIAMLLLALFGVALGWAPTCCAAPVGLLPDQIGPWDRVRHVLLPAAALSLLGVAQITMHTRQKMIEAMGSDFATYARAQGATTADVAWRHAIRHAAMPALTVQFAGIGELFGGSILAETVFTYPGLGQATVEAGVRGDVPLLLGIAIFTTVFVSIGNTIADVLYRIVDPRVRRPTGGMA